MKNFLLLFLLFTSFSCSKEEQTASLKNTSWNLIKVEAGFSESKEYEKGQAVWDFKDDSVEVLYTVEVHARFSIDNSGLYLYQLSDNSLKVDEQMFDVVFDGDSMKLYQNFDSGGLKITFAK